MKPRRSGESRICRMAATQALSTLADGVTLWCTERDRQFVMTQATDAETGLLGGARRMD